MRSTGFPANFHIPLNCNRTVVCDRKTDCMQIKSVFLFDQCWWQFELINLAAFDVRRSTPCPSKYVDTHTPCSTDLIELIKWKRRRVAVYSNLKWINLAITNLNLNFARYFLRRIKQDNLATLFCLSGMLRLRRFWWHTDLSIE